MVAIPNAIEAAKGIDPLTLAILFLGLTGLGLIWLIATIVKARGKK